MALDVAFAGVILDSETDLQTPLVIKVAVPGNDYSDPGAVRDSPVKLDGAWEVAGHNPSLCRDVVAIASATVVGYATATRTDEHGFARAELVPEGGE